MRKLFLVMIGIVVMTASCTVIHSCMMVKSRGADFRKLIVDG